MTTFDGVSQIVGGTGSGLVLNNDSIYFSKLIPMVGLYGFTGTDGSIIGLSGL